MTGTGDVNPYTVVEGDKIPTTAATVAAVILIFMMRMVWISKYEGRDEVEERER